MEPLRAGDVNRIEGAKRQIKPPQKQSGERDIRGRDLGTDSRSVNPLIEDR
jgi:hypothetical protein